MVQISSFPYSHAELSKICDSLSTVLHKWSYPAGLLECHWVNCNLSGKNTTVSRHNHRFYEGFVLLKGDITLITPWETQHVESGSIVLFSPGTVHQWQTHDQPCLWLVLSFDLDHALITPQKKQWPVCPELIWVVTQIYETINLQLPGWQLRANSYLGVIYASLVSLIETPSDEKKQIETTSQLITRVDELLQENLNNPMTLEEIATEVSMSSRHLTRQFKATTGMTIHDRLEAIRMERAAGLLRRTNLSIEEIAGNVGIVNSAYFAKRFRQRFDISPYKFRKK
jgi:AraC-like DNA-binding protein